VIDRTVIHLVDNALARRLATTSTAVGVTDEEEMAERLRQRARTVAGILKSITTLVVFGFAFVAVLASLGVDVGPLILSAGVVGIAIGFGAQSLVKDYFTGFFLLLENQLARGDAVEIAGKVGQVEDVTLRYVQLRDYDGNVHFIPNSLITTVTNSSRGYANAVADISVAHQENLGRVFALMRSVGEVLRADPAFADRILEPLEIAGVERWDGNALVLRCRFRVRALEQANVRRELLRRLKDEFDLQGIRMPQAQVTLVSGTAGEAAAARA
jgi:small conductance mechanosensitive channel